MKAETVSRYVVKTCCVLFIFFSFALQSQTVIFSENMGTSGAGSNPPVGTFTGYQNSGTLTFSGTGDVRTTTPSTGYAGASGVNNVLINAVNETFEISSINTSACSSMTLSFGVLKANNAETGTNLVVAVSTDGITYTPVSFAALPTGVNGWYLRTVTAGIPSATNLRIRFTALSSTPQFRIDDVKLEGNCGSSNTITTGIVNTSPFALTSCTATASGTVDFTSVGTFAAGNTYTAQLSNASGSFASPVNIGTLSSTANTGTINITIPAGTASGTGYLIRVISNNPSVTGSASSAITITLTCNSPTATCSFSGAMGNGLTNGCGDGAACNLASVYSAFGSFCGATSNAACSSCPSSNMATRYTIPAGCLAVVSAEFKKRGTGCSNSGMDSGDLLSITSSGGTVSGQSASLINPASGCTSSTFATTFTTSTISNGCGNSDGIVTMSVTGGQVTISGTSDRGDEIITFSLSLTGICGTNCDQVLPVSVIDFYAAQNGDKNNIVWRIAAEENISNYIIEKSEDGINFTGLYWAEPLKNKTSNMYYSTEDLSPYKGTTYYRLSTLEADGTIKHYKMISSDRNNKNWGTFVYQLSDDLFVEFKNQVPENCSLDLYDLSGKKLVSRNVDQLQTKINTQELAAGIYFMTVSTPYKTENLKVVIQK